MIPSPRPETTLPSAPVRGRGPLDVDAYVSGILAGRRVVLARAITLIESRHPGHEQIAEAVLGRVLGATGRSQRIGITGVPGVGKSTFIDAFGSFLTARGHKLAVLAVDPTSSRTGGSILADKTRMARLATDPAAFIRPSPASGTLGGVARMTRETMLLCEAAGFDVILVETVGVGQSETVVADMVDVFVALMLPGAGDELQGIKKGLVELADLILINKAEGENRLAAAQAARHYANALRMIEPSSPSWRAPVLTISALLGEGLDRVWSEIERHRRVQQACCEFAARRRAQQVRWFRSLLEDRLLALLRRDAGIARLYPELEAAVAEGRLLPPAAVTRLIEAADFLRPQERLEGRTRRRDDGLHRQEPTPGG